MNRRALARASIALFVLSSAFPIVAGALDEARRPRWLGIADVVIAALTFAAAALVAAGARGMVADRHRAQAYRASQAITAAIPLLLAAFFVLRARVDWPVLVIGVAWRAWLLLYTLPFLLAALHAKPGPSAASGTTDRSTDR